MDHGGVVAPPRVDGWRELFAVLPRGVDDLAREEFAGLGAGDIRATSGGLSFRGDLAIAYRACLWSRLASRILLPLARVSAASSTAFYEAAQALPWEEHLDPDSTFAVDARVRGDRALNSHFVALRTKDAIVDRLRQRCGRRPDVDREHPALRIHVLIDGPRAQLSIDLSGEPLHRRGYRARGGTAPLKENIAAAMLLRGGWPGIAAAGGALVDPMCGAGTLLVEGALMAADIAPGLLREHFGFRGWVAHDEGCWRVERAAAERRREDGRARLPLLAGGDSDPAALWLAESSLAAAGVGAVQLRAADVGDCAPPAGARPGLVATNAPYGRRMGERSDLPEVYRRLGEALKARFDGWELALLSVEPSLAREVRMRSHRRNTLWNGALRCELSMYHIGAGRERSEA